MNGVFNLCSDVSGTMGSFNMSTSFTAPMAPGIYYINPLGSWQVSCLKSTAVGNLLGTNTLGVLIVY